MKKPDVKGRGSRDEGRGSRVADADRPYVVPDERGASAGRTDDGSEQEPGSARGASAGRQASASMDFVLMLHSHLPYVLNHGRWPHGSDWICEAAIDTYLPILEALRALDRGNVAAPITIGFTPILANQLEHPTFHRELEAYFTQRLLFCDEAPASMAGTPDEHLLPLVGYWHDRLTRLRALYREIEYDILGQFRAMQDRELIEITSSAATHGFLPLLGRDESIRLQLALGRVEHRRIFGRMPEGCWIPECAYRPRGRWSPLPSAPRKEIRRGIEEHLSDAGYRYFFVDSHLARAGQPLGVYGEMVGGEAERVASAPYVRRKTAQTPYRPYRVTTNRAPGPVDVLVRDPRSSAQVWSRHGGYPGAAPYLEFHKIRWPGGLRLWRVSEKGKDLGEKEAYDPAAAEGQSRAHAGHFAQLLGDVVGQQREHKGNVIVAPFDTELFGHWWYEGPDFLRHLYAALPYQAGIHPVTAGQHFDAHEPRTTLRLARGSWGKDGDWSMWLGPLTEWTWPVIWGIEESFWDLAPRAMQRPEFHPMLAQAARAMLLLQSSDWQFIISTGEVEDYAIKRFNGHADDARALLTALGAALDGADPTEGNRLAAELQQRDDVFREILPSIEVALDETLSPAMA